MRAVIQRVLNCNVEVEGVVVSSVRRGLLVLLGIEDNDTDEDIEWLVNKMVHLRIFQDENQLMNLSLQDVDGEMMIVSQFTLHASTKKGNRPSFIRAAKPERAIPLYEKFISVTEQLLNKPIKTGEFGAMMQVHLVNDGPVTIIIDTKIRE